jgi:predicted  nucleic acid-binding Zn-ribbon protein
MELLYFLMGALTLSSAYSLYVVRVANVRLRDAEEEIVELENELEKFYDDTIQANHNMFLEYNEIKETLSKDSYEGINAVNERVNSLVTDLKSLRDNYNRKTSIDEKAITNLMNEIQQVNNRIKSLSEDPNFLNRY